MSKTVKLAIVGVGNCASSLLQGIDYYRDHGTERTAGLLHEEIGGYRIQDIRPVAAFDVDRRKVAQPLHEAVFASPNCTTVFQRELSENGVVVPDRRAILDRRVIPDRRAILARRAILV